MAAVRQIESSSVTEKVATELRRSIVSGDLAPGQSFSLREIAAMLGVSFIPVREALRQLEGEGLVVIRPGRSAIVAPLDLDDLHAIYRLRRTLEPALARRSVTLVAEPELDRLAAVARDFGDPDEGIDAIYDAHHEFHEALLAPAASSWDLRMLRTLWRATERYVRIGFRTLDPDPEEHTRRRVAHQVLLEAFRSRDPERAGAALDEHLAFNEQTAIDALGQTAKS
ncbi:GntR family transcriptional regulator [Enemella evansiae]|uniref:GntR family transcriptional regulator n=1 Tax=Enemella evansiae TaxID=2016499 RepID=UPI000B973D16|nr:GntR family transcriptional regulator [Enemella evansiae]OYO12145.1 GntR family transcriptional regulator [Enemella evansiae]